MIISISTLDVITFFFNISSFSLSKKILLLSLSIIIVFFFFLVQAPNNLDRPFSRRRLKIFLPPTDLLRFRYPHFLFFRIRDGWNVRLINHVQKLNPFTKRLLFVFLTGMIDDEEEDCGRATMTV